MASDPFGARSERSGEPALYRLERLAEQGVGDPHRLPHTVKVLLENLLRQAGGRHVDTSDVEALSVLFQEGLVNFAVQVLTLVVIAVALFFFNVKLAIITLAFVIPPMVLLSLWFRKVSDDGYTLVRNRIADVLSDLSESLAGIRIITAYNRRRHNVINHVNFDAPIVALNSASFGQIQRTAVNGGDPRIMQFALKLAF